MRMLRKEWATKLLSRIFDIVKILDILRFFQNFILFLQKIPLNFQIVKKTEYMY